MRSVFVLITVLILFSVQGVTAQTEPVKTVFVYKDFSVITNPRNADIFTFNENGAERKTGNDSVVLALSKGGTFTIEVRKEGFRSVRRIYERQKGGIDK